jgi:Tfp pilus assembly protein PilN
MNPIRIDFAPRTFARAVLTTAPLTWLAGLAGLVLCIIALVFALDALRFKNAQTASLQTALWRLNERANRTPPPKKAQIPEAQANAINAAIQQLNLPWTDFFDAIEDATPESIALLSLEPDAKKHIIKGIAESKTSGGMIDYIEQLKKQPFFANVVLTKHEVNELDANKPLRFQFEAQWQESAP